MKPDQQKKATQYVVRMRCVVTKEVVCEDCTEEQARTNPWEHAIDEHEIEQMDWEVEGVREEQ